MSQRIRRSMPVGMMIGAAVWVLSAFVASAAPPEGRPASEVKPIRIGLIADLPTPGGPATVQAVRLAVEEVNADGGLELDGVRRPVELLMRDDRNDPELAARLARELIEEGVVALIGPNISRNAVPVSEVAQQAGIPMIAPGSTHPKTTSGKSFVFRAAFVDAFQGLALARFALENLKVDRAAILYNEDDLVSAEISKVFQIALEFEGGRVSIVESYPAGTTDFRSYLQRIREATEGRVALLLPNLTQDVLDQVEQIQAMDLDVILLGSDLFSLRSLDERSKDLEGAFFSNHWHSGLGENDERSKAFLDAYRAKYGEDPLAMSSLGYDAAGILFAAIRTAGTTAPEAVRDVLANLKDYQGVTGSISYEGTQGDPYKNVVILSVQDGKVGPYRVIVPLTFE